MQKEEKHSWSHNIGRFDPDVLDGNSKTQNLQFYTKVFQISDPDKSCEMIFFSDTTKKLSRYSSDKGPWMLFFSLLVSGLRVL